MTSKILLWLILFPAVVLAGSEKSSLDMLNLSIGSPFPLKSIFEASGPDRKPTIQFRVPNSGLLRDMFTEFEVALNRETKTVSAIFATREFLDVSSCHNGEKQTHKILQQRFQKLTYDEKEKKYLSKDENVFVTAFCAVGEDSHFHTLRIEIRGKAEDAQLKNAWSEFKRQNHER